ncbi:MAG: hypothetical protein PVG79_13495 [Gemmatimonadales bacterium]
MGSKLSVFLDELRRRKVYRVAGIYAGVGIAVSLGAAELYDVLLLPDWTPRLVLVLLLLGFPIALVLAWAYEVRPEEPGPGKALAEDQRPSAVTAQPTTAAEPTGLAEVKEGKSIVVLPFENLSPDPANAFFADGLTEEIITDLSKVSALKVISRTSAMAFKGTTKTVPAIARELDVRFALEGSVRREGDSLRITAQLIDGSSDAHLWAEKYSGTMEDVFDLQERLSRRIVDALKVTLSPEEDRRLADRPLTDVQAHDIWLRARQHALTLSVGGVDRARELVEQALSVAGPNALLHATLSWIHAVRFGGVQVEDADETLSLARQHATRAIELDPDLAWSLFAMAVVHLREADLQGFVRWGKKALDIERDSHTLAALSIYLAYAGRIEPARRYAEEAASLDPLSWLTTHAAPHADVYAGNAAAGFRRLGELADRFAPGDAWPAFEAAYAALQAGLEDEARAWFQKAVDSGSPFYSELSQLLIHILAGDRDKAEEVSRSATLAAVAGRVGLTSYLVGNCFAWLGKTEEAFEWMERGVEKWFTNHRFIGEYDRLIAPLRGTPRFEKLLEKAREREAALEV